MTLTKDQEAALRYADGEKGIDHMNVQVAAFAAGVKYAREQTCEALQFYGNPDSYCKLYLPELADNDPRTFAPVLQDGGALARSAL